MGNEKQQTAVEKLYNEMYKIIEFYAGNEQLDKCMVLLEQAKEIEKEKLEDSWVEGTIHWDSDKSFEQYYKETYGGGEQ